MNRFSTLPAFPYHSPMEDLTTLRNSFQFARVSQFLSMFHKGVGLQTHNVQVLENLLLYTEYGTERLENIFVKVLKKSYKRKPVTLENYRDFLYKKYRNAFKQFPFSKQDFDLADEPVEARLKVLDDLLEWNLENVENFRKNLKEDLKSDWRVEPFFVNSEWTFWLFDDSRLYKEDRNEENWQLLAWDLESFKDFMLECPPKLGNLLKEVFHIIRADLKDKEKEKRRFKVEIPVYTTQEPRRSTRKTKAVYFDAE